MQLSLAYSQLFTGLTVLFITMIPLYGQSCDVHKRATQTREYTCSLNAMLCRSNGKFGTGIERICHNTKPDWNCSNNQQCYRYTTDLISFKLFFIQSDYISLVSATVLQDKKVQNCHWNEGCLT